jgi:UDP-glucose 4-epimerase
MEQLMNILLTGGTGFIGSYVAMELIKNGHIVVILARNENKVPQLKKIKGIKMVGGDISDMNLLEKLIPGKDAVILVALKYTKQTGWEVLQDDTLPTVHISDIAAHAHVKHFIYTSSTAVNDNVYMLEQNKVDGLIKSVRTDTKQQPTTFYGATKAASENYLLAQSYQSSMRINIIRPGYTFGNPVIEGGSTQGDTRFHRIVKDALNNRPIAIIKNDGTQFVWAGDLAGLYIKILHGTVNRKIYFGLSKNFISWERIAKEAIIRCNSKSTVEIEDRNWCKDGTIFDVSDMKNDFDLEFNGWDKILEHLDYYITLESKKH